MKKDTPPYFEEKFSFTMFQDRRWITSVIACVGAISILIVYFQSGPNAEAFAAAEEAFHKWETNSDEASYLEMRKALKAVPTLEKKYEAAIAQKLVHTDKIGEALALAHHALQRIEGDVPFHALYGGTSLLIEQGSYQDALEQSVGLKEQMSRSCDWTRMAGEELLGGSLLYAHNLLRIACLQQELHNKPGEKAAWDELEAFLQSKDALTHLVYKNFQEKGLDLSNYMAERRKHL